MGKHNKVQNGQKLAKVTKVSIHTSWVMILTTLSGLPSIILFEASRHELHNFFPTIQI